MKNQNSILCICGHDKSTHGSLSCAGYVSGVYWCICKRYKSDNLKYLEEIYDTNKSI